MSASDRIWATEDAENFGEDRFHSVRPFKGATGYLRATPAREHAEELAETLRYAKQEMTTAYALIDTYFSTSEIELNAGISNTHAGLHVALHSAAIVLAKLEKEDTHHE